MAERHQLFARPSDWNQTQTPGLSLYLPLFTACCWTPDAYDMRSAATGGLICQFDYLNEKFPMEQAKAALAEVKENRKYWYGDFYPLTPRLARGRSWAAINSIAPISTPASCWRFAAAIRHTRPSR